MLAEFTLQTSASGFCDILAIKGAHVPTSMEPTGLACVSATMARHPLAARWSDGA
jgi:hypothetical protein